MGTFKEGYLRNLQDKYGIEIFAAYGNTKTDITVYEKIGVEKSRTFILGPHGGEAGTVAVGDDFVDHWPHMDSFPDANPRAPTESVDW